MAKGSKHINQGVQVRDDGAVYIRALDAATTSGFASASGKAGEIVFWLDESGDNFKATVVYSNGTTSKTLTVAFD
jgi:hypothetical protein